MPESPKQNYRQLKEYTPVVLIGALALLASSYAEEISRTLNSVQNQEVKKDLFEPTPIGNPDNHSSKRRKKEALCLEKCKIADGNPRILYRENIDYSEARRHLAHEPVNLIYLPHLSPEYPEHEDEVFLVLDSTKQNSLNLIIDESIILQPTADKVCKLAKENKLSVYIINSNVSVNAHEIMSQCIETENLHYDEEAADKLRIIIDSELAP